jgi:predicted O-linked N-acetylglucosamine transferase (SPINDLY family)
MGSDCHDYIIGDPIISPLAHEAYFSEKIIQLPSYQANDNRIIPPPTTKSREDYGLPSDAFVFCSFNANYKITPSVFSTWMCILKSIPKSVLWLHCKNEIAITNLRNVATAYGIREDRLIFARTVPYDEHLSRHRLADLFLDTTPYNAGATASNALYCGLPLVTLAGRTFASRYGASLLTALGLPELITHDTEDYIAQCVRIATDRAYHAELKTKLAKNLETQLLFDTARFTASLEQAYQAIHTHYTRGQSPSHITVADLQSDNFCQSTANN